MTACIGRLVLITGATGFVGRHLVPALSDQRWQVRSAQRQRASTPEVAQIDSIGPMTDWSGALRGVDAVVHLAARVHHPGEENNLAIYQAVNTDGTLKLAAEAARAGVKDFIHVSTILVNGSSTDGRGAFNENDPPNPRGIYGRSKAAAETGLERIARDSSMNVTIIRPPMIYGHCAGGNFALLARAVQRNIPLPFASIRNRRSFLAVENLVSFIQHRLAHPSKFETFVLADDQQVSTPEFIRRIAAASGHVPLLFPVPQVALNLLCVASRRPEARDSLLGSMEIDTSKALETGWRPRVTLTEGLQLALRRDGQ